MIWGWGSRVSHPQQPNQYIRLRPPTYKSLSIIVKG